MGKFLVDFIYVVMILISLGDGNSQYTQRYEEYVQNH